METSGLEAADIQRCARCNTALAEHSIYCGQCGLSASYEGEPPFSIQKPLWAWIAPAIGLWVSILAINGTLGLSGHLVDISSPVFDLGAQLLAATLIVIFCLKSRELVSCLLCIGIGEIRHYLETVAAFAVICVCMFLYFKGLAFIGIQEISYLDDFEKHNWTLWSAFVLICVLPGVFEELAFRGYIMSHLEKVGSQNEALIIQAAMFSILHLLPSIFVSHFIFGLILGVLRLRTNSLYPGMLIHIGWNAFVIFGEII